jgi:hypothetical protein
MYENTKYKITKINDIPGPKVEVHVLWISENQYEKIFFNDEVLEGDTLINKLDDFYEQLHNKSNLMDSKEKKSKIESLKNKYCGVDKNASSQN